eukprot:scaffold56896_cov39-Cyclotella_meneghiniana.AAC.1
MLPYETKRLSREKQKKQLLEDGNNILPGTEDLSCEGAVIPTVHSGIHPTQRGQVEEWPINRIDCGEAGSLGSTRETWSRIRNVCRGGRFVSYKSSCKSTHYQCTYRRCCNIHNRYKIKSMREKAEC